VSGLAGLLAGHHPPGIYQWHAAFPPQDVRHTVEHAGARFAYVDGWTHQEKTELLEALAETLELPGPVGDDFDALADSLRGLDGKPIVLLWDGWGPLARSDERAFEVATDIFAGRAKEGDCPMTVLLRGGGPDIDVPSLDG
jgi:RNAse (barnase) inhibitor barstar